MPTTLTLFDETATGERRDALTVTLLEPTITARELIRTRVFEECKRYNSRASPVSWNGLVRPAPLEAELNGPPKKKGRKLDWHKQAEIALRAFESNGFILLVDDRQVESLSEQIRVREDTQVSFLKLVPLVGG